MEKEQEKTLMLINEIIASGVDGKINKNIMDLVYDIHYELTKKERVENSPKKLDFDVHILY